MNRKSRRTPWVMVSCILWLAPETWAEFTTGLSASGTLDNRDPWLTLQTTLPDTVLSTDALLLEGSALDHGSPDLALRLWGRPADLEERLLDSLQRAPGGFRFEPVLEPGSWVLRVEAVDAFGNRASTTLPELVVLPATGIQTPGLPGQFTLEAPVPNPFNPTCRIRYHLPHAGHARLGVYTSSGRRVHQADLGWQPAGDSTWDLDGNALASGLYLLDLAWAGQHRQTRLLLVK